MTDVAEYESPRAKDLAARADRLLEQADMADARDAATLISAAAKLLYEARNLDRQYRSNVADRELQLAIEAEADGDDLSARLSRGDYDA